MSNYRITSVLAPKDLGASGTEVIDVNLKDIISTFDFIWKTTNVTVSVMLAPHMRCISKVELVDGSDVLHSLSGEEMQALNYYDTKRTPQDELSLTVGGIFTSKFSINFGRYLYDTMLALDPNKFRNLQLKVTWDEDAANTSVVVNELTVTAHVFDEKKVSPRGFLMAKEVFSYTPVASGFEYVDLPTDYPYRKLVLKSDSTDLNPFVTIDQFKISENNDKVIPVNLTGEELFRLTKDDFPRMQNRMTMDAVVTAKTIYVVPSYDNAINIEYDGTAFVTAQSLFAAPTYTNQSIALAASVDIQADNASYSGLCPHSCLVYEFGDQNDVADFYDVRNIGSLQLQMKGAAAVGTSPAAKIVLQQLRTY